jgi:chemotaxis protein MotB
MAGKRKQRTQRSEHVDERWLLTYSDLITLLMALFMVLFSISSVNKSKFESLQHSLQDAFSGKIMPGGKSIKESGGTANIVNPSSAPPQSNLQPYVGGSPKESTAKQAQDAKAAAKAAQAAEQLQFEQLKRKLDRAAAARGLSSKIKTTITDEGLMIRLLTDELLFDSGSATVRPPSLPLLKSVASLLATQTDHQLVVSGHTDSQPIHSGQFQDNLALSTARAESIFRTFQSDGISPKRMMAGGRASYQPLAPNSTPGGRSINRRVEILVPRVDAAASLKSSDTPVHIPSIKPNFTKTH